MWAVLSDPALRGGGWQERVDEFYASGRTELDGLFDEFARAGMTPPTGSAFDFGCGLGRVTVAMAGRYEQVVGMDHSSVMIRQAAEAARSRGTTPRFVVGASPAELDEMFDLVWCRLVVQHQPTRADAWRLVDALADRVAPRGVLALQVPVRLGWRRRIQPRRRLYAIGRRVGVGHDVLFHRIGLNPVRMLALDEVQLSARLARHGIRVATVMRHTVGPDQVDGLFIATRPG